MSTQPLQKTTGLPQILRSDKAFKLAEQWVNSMSKDVGDETPEIKPESRYHSFCFRLGLGAKISRNSKFAISNDPIARKLHSKLEAGKKRAAKSAEDLIPSARGGCNDEKEDDSDGELESRTSVFEKKRVGHLAPSTQVKKKQK